MRAVFAPGLKAVLFLAVIFLHGCAVIPKTRPLAAYASQPGAEGLGLLVVSLSVNTGEISAATDLTFERIDAPKPTLPVTLYADPASPGSTVFFSLAVPAGKYKLSRLGGGSGATPQGLYLDVLGSRLLGPFDVQAGRVTDLGRLVLTAVNTKVLLGRSEKFTDNTALAAEVVPQHQGLLQTGERLGWNEARHEKDYSEALALARPQGMRGLSELKSGEVLAGTRMGYVLRRDTAGKWHVLANTGQHEWISATAAYDEGDSVAVVATERGVLYRVNAAGNVQPLARGNLPRGDIVFLGKTPDGQRWFSMLQRNGMAEIYASPRLDNGEWTLAKAEKSGMSAWYGALGAWIWRTPTGFGFTSTAGSQIACYDAASNQWSSRPAPMNRKVIGVAANEKTGALGVLTSPGGGIGGVFAKTHYTTDCGATWVQTDSPYSVKVSAPLVLADGSVIERGGVFGDAGIYRSTAQGKSGTWTKVSSGNTLTTTLWQMPTQGLFTVSSGAQGFEIVQHSGDGGATWGTELSSFIALGEDKAAKK